MTRPAFAASVVALAALGLSTTEAPVRVPLPDAVESASRPLYEPTPPAPVRRMLAEWESASTLVVALPEAQMAARPAKERFFLDLIATAIPYVKVIVLVSRDDTHVERRIREGVAARGNSALGDRIVFWPSVIDTEWIRDYGPLFGAGDNAELLLLDNMYRDIRAESDTSRDARGLVKSEAAPGTPIYQSDYGHFWRRNDDAAPMYINEVLYAERRRFPALVRTPLQLSGGDVAFTERGELFTSTRALEINGGDEQRFARLAAEYFNAPRVHYLRPLPRGMWHIDMFFRLPRPGVVLLAEAQTGEAREVLEWNRELIQTRLPGSEIIRVPMPDPLVTAGRQTAIYRSFLNSVFLDGGDGRSAVLVPSFSGLENMEAAVAAAYRRAYPGAGVHFIRADVMADEFAGVHCVTLTLPAGNLPSIPRAR